jgi:hypothetical protein
MRPTTFAVLAVLTLALAVAGPAAAHKTAYSKDGKIKIVWGFLNEPAVTMTKNGLDLRIQDNATGYAIPDLQSSLKVEMHYGEDVEMEFKDLSGQFGKPGYYTGTITPTKPGVYTLHIMGTVNGTELDLEIPASHDVEAIEETYFPALNDTGKDTAALEARVAALEAKVTQLDAKLKTQATTPTAVSTKEPAKPAPGFEPVLVLGALAAVAMVVALRRRS